MIICGIFRGDNLLILKYQPDIKKPRITPFPRDSHTSRTPAAFGQKNSDKFISSLPPSPPQKKKKSVGNPKLPICLSPTEIRENLWSLRPNKIVSYLRGRGGGEFGARVHANSKIFYINTTQ